MGHELLFSMTNSCIAPMLTVLLVQLLSLIEM